MFQVCRNFFLVIMRIAVITSFLCMITNQAYTANKDAIITNNSKHKNMKNHPIIEMKLNNGIVKIELYPELAPKHVARILTLTKTGFYDKLKFHRVIEDFMVQTGDPQGNGTGGSKEPNLPAEFNDMHHAKGVVSMARSSDINSANSQFFIMLGDAPHLDHQYTAFGKVISGMEFVEKIKKGDLRNNGAVKAPADIIEQMIVISE